MKIALSPINLHDPIQFSELQSQRLQCGWDNSPAHLLKWREMADHGRKSFFWITSTLSHDHDHNHNPDQKHEHKDQTERQTLIGHISLDSYSDLDDLSLASPDRSALTVQTFFIKHEYQRLGIGSQAMDLVEEMAREEPYGSPHCQYVTLSTLNRRHCYETGPVWDAAREILPPGYLDFCLADWYEKRGYVCWKSVWRDHEPDFQGRVLRVLVDFMRKGCL
ncbi:hypothetical protein EYZ11_006300 [Aspergillus tanneri]|uniref:N-acetyltransferase domain-containing protein n=1 Tax=Aspergillus tanneri TaxID=1220188 RepID=A0A4S3JLM4_9EURO|nr:uncharacterized protein ATNIH1004_004804 [Aspergillus tanneri]KAA8648917.1 hypothetical protein ATNIH1004_004804 [Aspergillus tanneri]THC94201.1 hypothetical protein EYZ11_006300 [Aspergillus tanneri]